MTSPRATRSHGTLGLASLILGIAAALLITVVSFIALFLAAAALVTGGMALGRRQAAATPVVGMVLALAAVALFVIEVAT